MLELQGELYVLVTDLQTGMGAVIVVLAGVVGKLYLQNKQDSEKRLSERDLFWQARLDELTKQYEARLATEKDRGDQWQELAVRGASAAATGIVVADHLFGKVKEHESGNPLDA